MILKKALEEKDPEHVRGVFKKAKGFAKLNKKQRPMISAIIKGNPAITDDALVLFLMAKKAEHIGNLLSETAEAVMG